MCTWCCVTDLSGVRGALLSEVEPAGQAGQPRAGQSADGHHCRQTGSEPPAPGARGSRLQPGEHTVCMRGLKVCICVCLNV